MHYRQWKHELLNPAEGPGSWDGLWESVKAAPFCPSSQPLAIGRWFEPLPATPNVFKLTAESSDRSAKLSVWQAWQSKMVTKK
jgi:hypothetical protein